MTTGRGAQTNPGRFRLDERVRVMEANAPGNPRTPRYVRGRIGRVLACHGVVDNPLDHRRPYPPLYTVTFELGQVGGRVSRDEVWVELHEDWLEPTGDGD